MNRQPLRIYCTGIPIGAENYLVCLVNLLLFQSILYKRNDWTSKALGIRNELEDILPAYFKPNLPVWARPLWGVVASSGKNRRFATLYVNFLNFLIKGRDSILSAIGR